MILSPPLTSPTLEPDRSTTSTPAARNMASISSHRISTGVGIAKTLAKVLRCLLRMPVKIPSVRYYFKYYSTELRRSCAIPLD